MAKRRRCSSAPDRGLQHRLPGSESAALSKISNRARHGRRQQFIHLPPSGLGDSQYGRAETQHRGQEQYLRNEKGLNESALLNSGAGPGCPAAI